MTDDVAAATIILWLAIAAVWVIALWIISQHRARRDMRSADDDLVLGQYTTETKVDVGDAARGDVSYAALLLATKLPSGRLQGSLRRLKEQEILEFYMHPPTGVRYRMTMIGRLKLAPRRGLNLSSRRRR